MKFRLLLTTILLAHSLSLNYLPAASVDDPPNKRLTIPERTALLTRAQVWKATNIASVNIKAGPPVKGAFTLGQTVACDYVKERLGGRTPKFSCAITPEDTVKVRYAQWNGEIYAGVAATRLLWALGFGADALYPVHVVCRGCPADVAREGKAQAGGVLFDVAAIERKAQGEELVAPAAGEGWTWPELDRVDERAGGAPLAHRDALKLLAAFLQHTDSKREQQRLVCLDEKLEGNGAACRLPFMMVHDVGLTFGRANRFNRNALGSVNLERWARTPIWRDGARCIANLSPSQTGTLAHPLISEAGRKFLADLLAEITDTQLRDLFEVARFGERSLPGGTGASPVSAWVDAFKQKRDEVARATCP